jgi:CheY-like chemotaxis protein
MAFRTNYEEVDMLQGIKHTVLLIEADRSLRRLITLGLQYRGMHVIEASSPTSIPSHFTPPDFCSAKIDAQASLEVWLQTILQSQLPDVVVLDIDSEVGSNHALLSTFQSHPYFSTIPLVILAWDCLVTSGIHQNGSQTSITCLAKPFDARTLHTTIEQIHNTSKVSLVSRQELLLANRSVTPTPSIWPLITAAGLVLSFIGMMTQITISALGLLIIFIALLWWTLGAKAEPEPLAV